jgi:hypothetical protein
MEEAEQIKEHIRECDNMFETAYGKPQTPAKCGICKKLLSMGFELTQNNLPEICIHVCDRWNLDPG